LHIAPIFAGIKPAQNGHTAPAQQLRVFVEHGDRTNRGKARLKYLLDGQGVDWFCQKTREMLESFGTGSGLTTLDKRFDSPRTPIDRREHIGVHPQSQDGLNYVGIALELGRMSGEQMRALGRIAAQYGANDIRVTFWQNPLILGVPDAHLRAVEAEIRAWRGHYAGPLQPMM